jgi:glycosyltransferase involved in cell wall biosynthesis
MAQNLVSIIAPVYNEEIVIEEFVRRVQNVIKILQSNYDFEIVLIDDGSRDSSLERLKNIAQHEPKLRVIQLRRNYGQTAALQAGLDAARGNIHITLDADLQHFPEEIPNFLDKLNQGYDVVCGWRYQRAEGIIRRWPSRLANILIHYISGIDIHDFGTTYRAYRAEFTKDLRLFGESHRFLPVLIANMGGKITEIPIQNIERPAGKSNYGISRTVGVLLDLILLEFLTHYLDRPLRIFGKVAAVSFITGFIIELILAIYSFISGINTVRAHLGWFLFAGLLMISSVQFLLTGILAEITTRVFYAQGDQRVYRVAKEWNYGT